jgi:hypothetical protein
MSEYTAGASVDGVGDGDKHWLTVPVETPLKDPIKVAARRESRPVTGYVRNLIVEDLRRKGLVDEDANPIAVTA